MTDDREASEKAGGHDPSQEDPASAAPRGADGESRVVAERSGADTSFPERPLLADPDDARAPARGDEESGEGVPQPKVGPTS
ncbi:hypothetical protein ABZV14_39240 [Streptosporangium canum]|uniref:hypothetical protein n=1 Tax=Streptosporangium canum TaxID=324952 RepID=UPI0033AA082B